MKKHCMVLSATLLAPTLASAHVEGGIAGGFSSGFTHPIFGYDHLLAMLAVGIWGAQLGGRSLWTLPVAFPLIMAVGGFFGAAGMPLPYVEAGIALSVVVLGVVITFKARPQEWIGLVIVGVFALFHGHAHGAELPAAANGSAYGIGFVFSTGLIHLAGIGIGFLAQKKFEGKIAQACGAAICLAGIYFLVG